MYAAVGIGVAACRNAAVAASKLSPFQNVQRSSSDKRWYHHWTQRPTLKNTLRNFATHSCAMSTTFLKLFQKLLLTTSNNILKTLNSIRNSINTIETNFQKTEMIMHNNILQHLHTLVIYLVASRTDDAKTSLFTSSDAAGKRTYSKSPNDCRLKMWARKQSDGVSRAGGGTRELPWPVCNRSRAEWWKARSLLSQGTACEMIHEHLSHKTWRD